MTQPNAERPTTTNPATAPQPATSYPAAAHLAGNQPAAYSAAAQPVAAYSGAPQPATASAPTAGWAAPSADWSAPAVPYETVTGAFETVTAYQPPMPPSEPRSRRGPGWGGVVAAAVVAAVLAAGGTAGAYAAFHHSTTPAASSGTAGSSFNSAAPVQVTGDSSGTNWQAVASAVEPSVVSVSVDLGNGSGDEGSGIVLDTSGHILTNNHVVADASGGATISVSMSDGRIYGATVLGTDPSTDLAVLKLTNPPGDLKPASFGDSSKVLVGDAVMAIGNPLGLAETATTGIVSAVNRPVTTTTSNSQQQNEFSNPFQSQPQAEPVVTNAIQTDASINPGNSGGALINSSGQVIGITSSIASLDESGSGESGNIGIGFAIPANEAKDVAQQLISTGTVKHAYLGITLGDGTATVSGTKRQAAIIGQVTAGTPAASAGLQADDAIVALNGTPIEDADSLVAQVRAMDPGTKITFTVVRDGTSISVPVTLAVKTGN